jgi:hypothetical protein
MPHSICHRSWIITAKWFDWHVSAVAHICSQILPFHSSVELLNIQCPDFGPIADLSDWIEQDEMDSTLWSQLFYSFTSVQSLEIFAPLEPFIAAALEGLTESSAAKVLPSLCSLSIVGKRSDEAVQQGIRLFVAARQHSSHPVVISRREVNWSHRHTVFGTTLIFFLPLSFLYYQHRALCPTFYLQHPLSHDHLWSSTGSVPWVSCFSSSWIPVSLLLYCDSVVPAFIWLPHFYPLTNTLKWSLCCKFGKGFIMCQHYNCRCKRVIISF